MKAQRKLTVLTRTRKYLNFNLLKIRFKTICQSQFKFCSLTWMPYSRNTNNKINKLHEKALRLAYNDCASTFEELLEKDKRSLFFIIIYKQSVKSYIKFTIICLRPFSLICLQEIILIIICAHNQILLFLKFKLFVKALNHLDTSDLLLEFDTERNKIQRIT